MLLVKERMTMKYILTILLLLTLILPAQAEYAVEAVGASDDDVIALDALDETCAEVWEAYRQAALEDDRLNEETAMDEMVFGEVSMRYTMMVFGDKPDYGYPLYIALHGGGAGETPDFNDSQWEDMQEYYTDELECGIYVAVRGVRDTWDTHFNPESYPLYDRLIEYMILTEDVDSSRVYLMGFSAGGDGVYAISARMPDRFAAANMCSGHPNGISLLNLRNLPIQLQAGEYDDEFDRNRVTAEYGLKLDELQEQFGGGYLHRTLIHYDQGHNYEDYQSAPIPVMTDIAAWLNEGDRTHENVDSYPPHYMDQFTRDPYPTELVWDLSTRAPLRETETFYYLSAPYETDQGIIMVTADGDNVFEIQTSEDMEGEFSMYLNGYMADLSRPVTFIVNGVETTLTLEPSRAILEETTADRGDPWYQFEAKVDFKH